MTTEEFKVAILSDDVLLVSELQKFETYFNLKHTIRWARDRHGDVTESVAEHVFGMHVLASYFLPLEDSEKVLNRELVTQMITWHDMAEAIVSDMTTKDKTPDHEAAEKVAEHKLVTTASPQLQSSLTTIYETYDARSTPEARFVKALDKIEPLFHLYFLKKSGVHVPDHYAMQWQADEYRTHRAKYINQFMYIMRFDNLLYTETLLYYPNK